MRLQDDKRQEYEHRTLQVMVSLLFQARGDGIPNKSKLERRIANNSLAWEMVTRIVMSQLALKAASEMLWACSMMVSSNELELVNVLSLRNAPRVVHVLRMNLPRAEVKMRMEAVVACTWVNVKAVPSCDHFVLWQ